MCLECSFYSFSTDTGCTVELVSSDSSSSVQYTETINRSGNGTAEGCVSGVARGEYDVKAYDQSSGMLIKTFAGEIVTEQTTTPITSTGKTISSTITISTRGIHYSTTSTSTSSCKCSNKSLFPIINYLEHA